MGTKIDPLIYAAKPKYKPSPINGIKAYGLKWYKPKKIAVSKAAVKGFSLYSKLFCINPLNITSSQTAGTTATTIITNNPSIIDLGVSKFPYVLSTISLTLSNIDFSE